MKQLYLFLTVCLTFLLSGCRESPSLIHRPDPQPKEVTQMTIVYAVNHNNLSSDLVANENQMLQAMGNIDADVYKLLVYKYTSNGPGLYEVRNSNGKCEFTLLKQYDESTLSVSKERVSEVLEDALDYYPDVESNLFFWGHGLGWVNPNKYSNNSVNSPMKSFSENSTKEDYISVTLPEVYGYGGEYVYEDGVRVRMDYLDLDQLAEAIPDHKFDMIWFDCCYMSGIEVAYQLRNKCETFVAYPTEIMAEGLPYNKIMPKIIGSSPDRVGAARALYEYYVGKSTPESVSVAVMDMSRIEDVAEAARNIFMSGKNRPSEGGLQNYSRLRSTPYYDFGQYLREYADANSDASSKETTEILKERLKSALDNFVVFSAASEKDFNYPVAKPIVKENFSGLSIHNFEDLNSQRDDYYRKLDWYGRVWNMKE